MLPDTARLTAEFKADLLNGVEVVKSRSVALAYDAQGSVRKKEQEFTAIPYYAWANRGPGQMVVWMPNTESAVRPIAFPTVATTAKVTTSGRKNPRAINSGEDPVSSSDSSSYFDWWPRKGTTEWVEYAFEKPSTVSEAEVYWFDDTGRGEVRVPASWRVLYKDGAEWKPVETGGSYGVEKDRYNRVTFKAVTTSGLRLEVAMHVFNTPTIAMPEGRPRHNPAFLHPDDMVALGANSGDVVELASERDVITAIVEPDPSVRPGTVSMCHSFGGLPGNEDDVRKVGSNPGRLIADDVAFDRGRGSPPARLRTGPDLDLSGRSQRRPEDLLGGVAG